MSLVAHRFGRVEFKKIVVVFLQAIVVKKKSKQIFEIQHVQINDISDRFVVLTVFTMPITAIVIPSGAKMHDFQTVANNAITANTIIIEPITMFAVCK